MSDLMKIQIPSLFPLKGWKLWLTHTQTGENETVQWWGWNCCPSVWHVGKWYRTSWFSWIRMLPRSSWNDTAYWVNAPGLLTQHMWPTKTPVPKRCSCCWMIITVRLLLLISFKNCKLRNQLIYRTKGKATVNHKKLPIRFSMWETDK